MVQAARQAETCAAHEEAIFGAPVIVRKDVKSRGEVRGREGAKPRDGSRKGLEREEEGEDLLPLHLKDTVGVGAGGGEGVVFEEEEEEEEEDRPVVADVSVGEGEGGDEEEGGAEANTLVSGTSLCMR